MGVPNNRPYMPHKTYYLELDGKPSCCSPRHPKSAPGWSCAHESHEKAQEAATRVWKDHPDCVIAVKEGPCPRYGDDEDLAQEYYSRWDDYG